MEQTRKARAAGPEVLKSHRFRAAILVWNVVLRFINIVEWASVSAAACPFYSHTFRDDSLRLWTLFIYCNVTEMSAMFDCGIVVKMFFFFLHLNALPCFSSVERIYVATTLLWLAYLAEFVWEGCAVLCCGLSLSLFTVRLFCCCLARL